MEGLHGPDLCGKPKMTDILSMTGVVVVSAYPNQGTKGGMVSRREIGTRQEYF